MEPQNVISARLTFLGPASTETADLGVVIVSWNVAELLKKNLETVFQGQGSARVRVIVVDNASKDGSADMVKQTFPDVIVIANSDNLGFAKAVNQGIDVSHARHVLLLNPDMQVSSDAFQKTVDYLDTHPDVAVLGAKLLAADGSVYPSVRRFPDIASQLAILCKLPHLFPSVLKTYLWSDFSYETEQSVPSVRGSYFAMSTSALKKLGKLDERYFIWFEEVDYAKAAVEAGMRVMYVPSIVAQDFVGKSFGQRKMFWKQKQFSKSMAQYFWKWHPGWRALLISCLRPFPMAFAWVIDHVRS